MSRTLSLLAKNRKKHPAPSLLPLSTNMNHPPARIRKAFRPIYVLNIQLFCLCETVRFRCVRCFHDRFNLMVAILHGDWSRLFCNQCYGDLIAEARDRGMIPRTYSHLIP